MLGEEVDTLAGELRKIKTVGMTIEVKLNSVVAHCLDVVATHDSGFHKNFNRGGFENSGLDRSFNVFAGASIDNN